MKVLNEILQNQNSVKADLVEIRNRLVTLEKGKLPMDAPEINKLYHRVEDEFIDLQEGFEIQTLAMVEALQRKFNRNTFLDSVFHNPRMANVQLDGRIQG